jgi:cytoskeletal protein CcmA (bactofilin family)
MYPFSDRSFSDGKLPLFDPDSFSGSVLSKGGTAQGALRLGTSDFLVRGHVHGPITTEGSVYVAGSGSTQGICASEVRVAEGAQVSGTVRASELHIGGTLQGAMLVFNHLLVRKTARVHGSVLTLQRATFEVELGARFTGSVSELDVSSVTSVSPERGDGSPERAVPASVRPPDFCLSSHHMGRKPPVNRSEKDKPRAPGPAETPGGDDSSSLRDDSTPENGSESDVDEDFGIDW